MYLSRNISSIISWLLITIFLASRVFPAACQKNYDNWIFGKGAYVSFKKGTAEAMPPLENDGCYLAYSDKEGNLLFSISCKRKHSEKNSNDWFMELSDAKGMSIICFKMYLNGYDYTKACGVADSQNKNIYHVFVYLADIDFKGEKIQKGFHHIKLYVDLAEVSLVSDDIYEDFNVDDFVALNVGNYTKLVVFDNSGKKIKTYDISDVIALESETYNPYTLSLSPYKSLIWLSPDGSYFLFKDGVRFCKVEFDVFGNILTIKDICIKNVHCIEFSPSGDYLFCGQFGETKSEYLILRYCVANIGKDHDAKADTIACLKKAFGEFTFRNDMLVGPDGNIYVGFYMDEYLSVIENPDSPLSECKFNYQSLYLNGAFFANSFQHVPRYLPAFRYTDRCGTVDFYYCGELAEKLLWDFGDGAASTEKNPIHYYRQSGTYEITLRAFFSENESKIVKRNLKIPKQVPTPQIICE